MACKCNGTVSLWSNTNNRFECVNCHEEANIYNNTNNPYYLGDSSVGSTGSLFDCQCGGEKTYGKEFAHHSSWCPKSRR